MALLGQRPQRTAPARSTAAAPGPRARVTGPWPGLALAAAGVAVAWLTHRLVPDVPMLTVAIVLGLAAAQVPGSRVWVRGWAKPGLTFAAKRLMRVGVVLLGLKLSLRDVLGVGWATVAMVLVVVAATFFGTWWLGRKLGLPGDQPLLIATGYSICGASAIGAVSDVSKSEERDTATSVAVVTLCGTLAIAVLPLLQGPLGLTDAEFGRWVGASVHDVGQVVATAQTAGGDALGEGVLVKLMRVALLAPLVAGVALSVRARRAAAADGTGTPGAGERRPPLVPLFVAGFVAMVAVRSTGRLPDPALDTAAIAQELLLAAALFGLGAAVDLRTLIRTGGRVGLVGLCAWVVVGGVSYAGVCLTG
ncbi:YeiH family protein [Streptomyces flavofungini]|uniref:Sulfate exporter family transporter n=1 Tax=Streptomyces flavofungini TaxID=68200 RepID=A0ABS0WZI1_9ACTN|nr:putative sulfate exporter family transporter [Streptomyces flavofungini]MBJ3806335.1 putative sulfate exporter family transporter [Streptomyces flavofungini]GHC45818.1 membrane protein [Streptomyces flavofungini]